MKCEGYKIDKTCINYACLFTILFLIKRIKFIVEATIFIFQLQIPTLPSQVRPSDYLDNRCVSGLYEREGVRASWIFIIASPVYWLWYGGHTQVRLSGLQELGRDTRRMGQSCRRQIWYGHVVRSTCFMIWMVGCVADTCGRHTHRGWQITY